MYIIDYLYSKFVILVIGINNVCGTHTTQKTHTYPILLFSTSPMFLSRTLCKSRFKDMLVSWQSCNRSIT